MNEGCGNKRLAAKTCVGGTCGITGITLSDNAPARWHSTQWLHVCPKANLDPLDLGWQGITNSSLADEDLVGETLSDNAFTVISTSIGAPVSGMTAAMAPANGSHRIIHNNNAFFTEFMFLMTSSISFSSIF